MAASASRIAARVHLRSQSPGFPANSSWNRQQQQQQAIAGIRLAPKRMPLALRAAAKPFSQEHSTLVKESWSVLRKDAPKHASAFFLKVFEIAPTVKPMFSFLRDTDVPVEKNPHLKSHALMVFTMTCEAALLLGDDPTLAALKPKLLDLGPTHVYSEVRDEHFDVVGYALLETLKEALKDQWTPEMKAAWSEAYSAVTTIIKDEMHALQAARAKSTPA